MAPEPVFFCLTALSNALYFSHCCWLLVALPLVRFRLLRAQESRVSVSLCQCGASERCRAAVIGRLTLLACAPSPPHAAAAALHSTADAPQTPTHPWLLHPFRRLRGVRSTGCLPFALNHTQIGPTKGLVQSVEVCFDVMMGLTPRMSAVAWVALVALLLGVTWQNWELQRKSDQLSLQLAEYTEVEERPLRAEMHIGCPRCGVYDRSRMEHPGGLCDACQAALRQRGRALWDSLPPAVCTDPSDVVVRAVPRADGGFPHVDDDGAERVNRALSECGYAYIERAYPAQPLRELAAELRGLLNSRTFRDRFEIPVSGAGRREYMVPFRAPFNASAAIFHPAILNVAAQHLHGHYRLLLLSFSVSEPGSEDQGWHQDWRYLFSPDARDEPYAIQVGVPLEDWSDDMGPTHFCPGRNKRFYNGKRCEDPVAAGSSLGDAVLWQYNALHRGPANLSNKTRTMLLMSFSRSFFLNTDAAVNRGVTMVQTMHQRRYWESFYWHPESGDFFNKAPVLEDKGDIV